MYEPPKITMVGAFADLTLGPNKNKLGDGVAFRGPDKVPPVPDVPVDLPNPIPNPVPNPPPPFS